MFAQRQNIDSPLYSCPWGRPLCRFDGFILLPLYIPKSPTVVRGEFNAERLALPPVFSTALLIIV